MKCRRCGGAMAPGVALAQTHGGVPDFPGGDVVTVSPSGPGRLIDCLKCEKCGHSVANARRKSPPLPLSEPRCIGHTVGGTSQLRLECMNCRRRTAPRAEARVWTEPPADHPCPLRIAEDAE